MKKTIDKKQAIAKHLNVSVEVIDGMFEIGLVDLRMVNRALTRILLPKYEEKHKTRTKAFVELADDLGITEHTVQSFVYNNRNTVEYTCDKCGTQITSYRHYRKDKMCAECFGN